MQQTTMFSKRLYINNWLPKAMLLILRHQTLVHHSLKFNMIQTNNILWSKFKVLTKKIPIPGRLVKKNDYNTNIADITYMTGSVNG